MWPTPSLAGSRTPQHLLLSAGFVHTKDSRPKATRRAAEARQGVTGSESAKKLRAEQLLHEAAKAKLRNGDHSMWEMSGPRAINKEG